MKYNFGEIDYEVEFVYPGTDGQQHTMRCDCVEAEKLLSLLGAAFQRDAKEDPHLALGVFDEKWREYCEAHGGVAMPEAILLATVGYVAEAVDEFKKKLPDSVASRIFTESIPSTLDELKSGRLKLAQTESSPSESSGIEEQTPSLPPSDTTNSSSEQQAM